MSLLTSPDMLPEAMRFLVRALLLYGRDGVETAELVDLVAPSSLVEAMRSLEGDGGKTPTAGSTNAAGQLMAKQSLVALNTFGALSERTRVVALADDLIDRWAAPGDVTAPVFWTFLLDRLFEKAKPNEPSGSDEGVTDFVQALELLYTAAEPMWPFDRFEASDNERTRRGRSFRDYQASVLGGDPSHWPVPNKEQWQPFLRWASYLGLAREVGSSGIIPDASVALAARLADIPAGNYGVEDFVTRCAEVLPLVDGGELQTLHQSQREGDTEVLSAGLSLSLMQLEADGVVGLTKQSDTGVRIMRLGRNKALDRAVTTVEWKPRAQTEGGRK